MHPIKDKYALVTGATKGIGRAISEQLADEGCNLVLVARTASDLLALQSELGRRYPVKVIICACDFIDMKQIKSLALFVKNHVNFLDILVNNVGLFIPGPLLESEDQLIKQMQVNVFSMHYLSIFFAKEMKARKQGHIVNVGSIAGRISSEKAPAYSVTKHAVKGLTIVLRNELAPFGVKVTELVPGSTLTASWEGTDLPKESFVQPGDVAACLLTALKMSKGANVDEVIVRPMLGDL